MNNLTSIVQRSTTRISGLRTKHSTSVIFLSPKQFNLLPLHHHCDSPCPDPLYFTLCYVSPPLLFPWTHYIPYMVLLLAHITLFPSAICQGLCKGRYFISLSIWTSIHFRWMDRQLHILPHHQDGLFMNNSLRFHPSHPWTKRWINEKWKNKSIQWNHHWQLNNSSIPHLIHSTKSSPRNFTINTKGYQVEHQLVYVDFKHNKESQLIMIKVSIFLYPVTTPKPTSALNLKELSAVIRTWTTICHIVCIHKIVLRGFISDFFSLSHLLKMSVS